TVPSRKPHHLPPHPGPAPSSASALPPRLRLIGGLGHDLAGIPTRPVATDHFAAGGIIDRLHPVKGQALVAVGLELEDPTVLAAVDEFRTLDLGPGTIGIGEEPPLPLQPRLVQTPFLLGAPHI